MPKRKRLLDEARDDGDHFKRRRRSLQYDSGELCQELYDAIRSHKDADGRLLCESFIRVPKRRNSADYYDVVSSPIDMLKIQQKVRTDEYEDLEQMTSDVELMVSNAKIYYKKSSQEYKDAVHLWDYYISTKSQLLNSFGGKIKDDYDSEQMDGNSGNQSGEVHSKNIAVGLLSDDDNPLEELFAAVMMATDSDGKVLCTSMQLLPSRRRYLDYYKFIREPMDLKMVATKIQTNEYQNLNELERDLLVIVKNAKSYNIPGSHIYKDAVSLRKVITSKKIEIEHGRITGAKSSERIRARRLAGGQRLSVITAALQYESDGDDEPSNDGNDDIDDDEDLDEMEDDDDEVNEGGAKDEDDDDIDDDDEDEDAEARDISNPQWQVFNAVRSHESPKGYLYSEPFMRKPNKRKHPDYYRRIKHPISMSNIRSKVKKGLYVDMEDLVDDMNKMFENAKKYNRPDSDIFKDAVKLQKFMQTRAREFVNLDKDDSDDDEMEKSLRRRSRKSLTPYAEERRKMQRRNFDVDPALKKRMKILYKALLENADENGRPLITLFMEKPSKKNYPDYYQVISEPIDMKMIEVNIRQDKYNSDDALVADFHLMFSNCKQYNEEGSQIYRDAETLEKVLLEKVQELSSADVTPKIKIIAKKSKAKVSPVILRKLQTLYETILDYSDKGRKLSTIFMKLPSRLEYPDYYEVIKRPMDMQRIQSRMNAGHFETLEELISDFVLMLDNACKYNEPESQIYKDALTLQRVVLQTKAELNEDVDGNIPDVHPLVQELLTSLFTYVYNHQDEEGRCYVDSLAELSESRASDVDGATKLLTLDMIKRNLDKGRYRRLDTFQQDMFEVFETARRISRTDSQVFEDSLELELYFMKMRDDLCKGGEILLSPALRVTEKEMTIGVEALRSEKLPKEKSDDEQEKEQDGGRAEKERRASQNTSDSVDFREQIYRVGDFVYIEPREKGLDPHIIHIDKFFKDEQGEQWLYGCWYYRPNETFHLTTRKFLEKELFKSDNYNSAPMNQVQGKCYVMFVKDYFKNKPQEFLDKDVYVCESRYSARTKSFKKIKVWPAPFQHVYVLPRDCAIIPTRIPSVFKERVECPKEDSFDVDEVACRAGERTKPNVIYPDGSAEENIIYYEQYNIPSGSYKIGDCVFVRSENGRQLIARIDKMWEDKMNANVFFHGPWFVTLQEIANPPARVFHKQEVFLSSIEDTNPLLSVTGRCYVMDPMDYVRCRPTEIAEQNIFLCESRYLEAERQIHKLSKGLRKFVYSDAVLEDEIYFFKKPITTFKCDSNEFPEVHAVKTKVVTLTEPSVVVPKTSDAEMEDSNDGNTPSVGSIETPILSQSTSVKKKPIRKVVTGYILYSGETRKSIITKNPDSSFGDISRLVGTEWRSLPAEVKAAYEVRAQKLNDQMPSKDDSLASNQPSGENIVYECLWEKCDYQFEGLQDLIDHVIAEPNGHVHKKYNAELTEAGEFHCLWQGCPRLKKSSPPFQLIHRLIRHCREVHCKTSFKIIVPADRGKNYISMQRPLVVNRAATPVKTYAPARNLLNSGRAHHLPYLSVQYGQTASKSVSTMFVTPPPKPRKLLHSEAYLRYIEGLKSERKAISNWDINLRATQENTLAPMDISQLPVHWLGNGIGNHGNAVNALWALRDYMMKDALNIKKVLC